MDFKIWDSHVSQIFDVCEKMTDLENERGPTHPEIYAQVRYPKSRKGNLHWTDSGHWKWISRKKTEEI